MNTIVIVLVLVNDNSTHPVEISFATLEETHLRLLGWVFFYVIGFFFFQEQHLRSRRLPLFAIFKCIAGKEKELSY